MTLPVKALTTIVAELFSEAYTGPNHGHTWFTGHEPHSGILGTLGQVGAEDASRLRPTGSTIAAHAEHLRWSLAVANAFTRGETPAMDWAESWSVKTVNAADRDQLCAALKREYAALYGAIQNQRELADEQLLTATLAFTPHAAYHLGALRQMVGVLATEV